MIKILTPPKSQVLNFWIIGVTSRIGTLAGMIKTTKYHSSRGVVSALTVLSRLGYVDLLPYFQVSPLGSARCVRVRISRASAVFGIREGRAVGGGGRCSVSWRIRWLCEFWLSSFLFWVTNVSLNQNTCDLLHKVCVVVCLLVNGIYLQGKSVKK